MSFGDGSDGDVVISVNTTLTADMNYNNLTVNAGVTLYPDGYVIYVLDTLTLNGTISRNGNNGQNAPGWETGGIGGAGLPTHSVGGSASGGTGGSSDGLVGQCFAATSGSDVVDGIADSNGGAGGTPSGTVCAGATGAGGSTSTTHNVDCNDLLDIITNAASRMGGPGGGGGGSCVEDVEHQDSGSGGGGGSGAGVIYISARTITSNGGVSAIGGNGGNPNSGTCTSGIGGGGGGGTIVIEYNNKDNYTGTVSATGGTGANTGTVGTIAYCFTVTEITISGNIKNSDTLSLPDVKITLRNTDNYQTSTDINGNYNQVVSPDVYVVTASITGNPDQSAQVDASLLSQTQNFVFPITTAPDDKATRLRERYLQK